MNQVRRIVLVAVLVVSLSVGGATIASLLSTDDTGTGDELAVESIRDRMDAARATVELSERLLIPRIAGLGLGLAVGLAGGAVVAFVRWGGRS